MFIPKFVIQSARGKAVVWARKWNMWRYKCQRGEVTVAYCQFWCDTESSANPLSYRDTRVGGDCYLKQFAGSTPFFLRVSFRLIEQHFFLGLVCNNPGASSGKTLKNIERRSSPSKAACITLSSERYQVWLQVLKFKNKIKIQSETEQSVNQSKWSVWKLYLIQVLEGQVITAIQKTRTLVVWGWSRGWEFHWSASEMCWFHFHCQRDVSAVNLIKSQKVNENNNWGVCFYLSRR